MSEPWHFGVVAPALVAEETRTLATKALALAWTAIDPFDAWRPPPIHWFIEITPETAKSWRGLTTSMPSVPGFHCDGLNLKSPNMIWLRVGLDREELLKAIGHEAAHFARNPELANREDLCDSFGLALVQTLA